jgi:hypothetical protein
VSVGHPRPRRLSNAESPETGSGDRGVLGRVQVVRTVVVVMDAKTYRIEVLMGYRAATAPYTARCWMHRLVTMPPTASIAPHKGAPKDEGVTLWVEHPFASPVEGKSRKEVLAQALACLAEQPPSAPT